METPFGDLRCFPFAFPEIIRILGDKLTIEPVVSNET